MSHNLNIENGQASMMFVGQVPWHGLGTRLEKAPATAADAIKAAGLDWDVKLMPVYCSDGQHFYEIPERKATVRMDKWGQPDLVPFALVSNDYKIMQNREVFDFFDPIVASGKIAYETAGALGHGEKVWVLAKVEGQMRVKGNDLLDKYLLISTGHDARTAVQIRFTPVRVVCQNTLTSALSWGSDVSKVYHVPGMRNGITDAQKGVKEILGVFDDLETRYNKMADHQMDDVKMAGYLGVVFPDPPRKRGQSDWAYESALQKVHETRKGAMHLFEKGRGNDAPPINGTLWAAYNGVVELVDHHWNYRDRWQRLESLWFGEEERIKRRAFEEACKMCNN